MRRGARRTVRTPRSGTQARYLYAGEAHQAIEKPLNSPSLELEVARLSKGLRYLYSSPPSWSGCCPGTQPPIITVMQPIVIELGGPIASKIVSPTRQAPRLFIITVLEGVITTPGPWGGTGDGVVHMWMSAPPAAAVMAPPIAAADDVFRVCSAA